MTGPDPPSPVDPESVPAFRRALMDWYRRHRRDLPWRRRGDPYAIWVAEVMLQQTRVETVIPYYHRWMERFPDVTVLAAAPEEEVLRLWQGLGYYSRARNLHRAAQEVLRWHAGRLPETPKALRSLPGVGEYTAGAVASIAFGQRAPAVDGNVRRVLARLADDPAPSPARMRGWAADLVDPERPGDFNQALMELGSRVCSPSAPACGACPVADHCGARTAGTQAERPAPRRRAPVRTMDVAVAAVVVGAAAGDSAAWSDGGTHVALRRRPSKGLLGGMWELPGQEVSGPEEAEEGARRLAVGIVADLARRRPGSGTAQGSVTEPVPVEAVSHAFSHRRARYHPFLFRVPGAPPPTATDAPRVREAAPSGAAPWTTLHWVGPTELSDYPLPVAQRKVLRAIGVSLPADD